MEYRPGPGSPMSPASTNINTNSLNTTAPTTTAVTPSSPTGVLDASERFTLHITFHSAHNLPVADIPSFSSDPYIIATLRFPGTDIPKLHYRTKTLHTTLEPRWDAQWSVANVPATGARLKIKVMDEDRGDHDDVLGVTYFNIDPLESEDGQLRELSKLVDLSVNHATWIGFSRIVTVGCGKGRWKGLGGQVNIGISTERNDGTRSENEEWSLDRAYTISPNWWSQHFSPLIGIITHTSGRPSSSASHHSHSSIAQSINNVSTDNSNDSNMNNHPSRVGRYSFAATKIQLSGPVPPELSQRYVAFRPIIKTFYTKSGLMGVVLNRALKHQYRSIYSYDKFTTYGICSPEHSTLARHFLDFTHWGTGGRLYTYIITLDGEWRFTETGKEFSIQMLSKHTMHSCVSEYVAFAGEFFVQRRESAPPLQHSHSHLLPPRSQSRLHTLTNSITNRYSRRSRRDLSGTGDDGNSPDRESSQSPHEDEQGSEHHHHEPELNIDHYELVIDNDSGTYRPPPHKLQFLRRFLEKNITGLHIVAADAFDEAHIRVKKEHVMATPRRARFKQPSNSIGSSSDDSDLEDTDRVRRRRRRGRGWRRRASDVWSNDEKELQTGKIGVGRRVKKFVWEKVENVDRKQSGPKFIMP